MYALSDVISCCILLESFLSFILWKAEHRRNHFQVWTMTQMKYQVLVGINDGLSPHIFCDYVMSYLRYFDDSLTM